VVGAERHNIVAAAALHELPRGDSLLLLAEALHERHGSWWLDSALAGGRLGRFSFAGAEPYAVARASAAGLEIETRRAVRPDLSIGRTHRPGDPLGLLEDLLSAPLAADPAPHLPLLGGAVGWLGYELAARDEPRLPRPPLDEPLLPDLCFLLVDRLVALDHASGRRFACVLGFGRSEREARARAAQAAAAWSAELVALEARPPAPASRAPRDPRRAAPPGAGSLSLDAPAHAKAVAFLLERIEAGDVYQACLTHRFERAFSGDPWHLYRALRTRNPAPFAAWLSVPEAVLCSSSPERFLAVDAAGRVESRPIKGTRPRSEDPARDAALARELARSAKDNAENLMIVDLVRHDLGRVCETGSVAVPELRAIESYATVHQMVSTVTGRLRRGAGRSDAIRAAFPPGSMTGAPKLAAMQLLAGLEPVRRGAYSGALGYLDVRGGADLAVVIRTAVVAGGRAFVHSGGGIVADSEPAAEWRESLVKARVLLEAIGAAEGEAACP
jgi:para-aminobenzoate synthetase component I